MAKQIEDKEIFTIKEAAKYLSIGTMSIRKLIKNKKIPHKKILNRYRFVKSDLQDWVAGKERES